VINSGLLGYSRTFDLFGQTGAAAVILPYIRGDLSGDVDGQGRSRVRGKAIFSSAFHET